MSHFSRRSFPLQLKEKIEEKKELSLVHPKSTKVLKSTYIHIHASCS